MNHYFRERQQGSSKPLMSSQNILAGFWTEDYVPTGYHKVTKCIVPSNDGWGKYCADFVNSEFTLGRKNKKHSRSWIWAYRGCDLGSDLTMYSVRSKSQLKGFGIYRWSNAPVQFRTYEGGFLPYWPATMSVGGYSWNPTELRTAGVSGLFSGERWSGASEGPRLWNKARPKLSTSHVGQAVAEGRELVPMLKTTARGFKDVYTTLCSRRERALPVMSKRVGNQWLNTQFGWKPFLSDIESMCKTTLNASSTIEKLRAKNDKWVRRRTQIESNTLAKVPDLMQDGGRTMYNPNGMYAPYVLGMGKSYISAELRQDTWLSAAFKYFVPEFESPNNGIELVLNYLRLYGIWVSPLLIWNLTPWSWLVDWFCNAGANIANYTASIQDNLVGRYAYVMRTTSAVFTNTSQVAVSTGTGTSMRYIDLSWELSYLLKVRRHASPYGFTVDWPNFSAFQLSILAALGATKTRI